MGNELKVTQSNQGTSGAGHQSTTIVIKRKQGITQALFDLVNKQQMVISDGSISKDEWNKTIDKLIEIQKKRKENNGKSIYGGGDDRNNYHGNFIVHPDQEIEFTEDEMNELYEAMGVSFADKKSKETKETEEAEGAGSDDKKSKETDETEGAGSDDKKAKGTEESEDADAAESPDSKTEGKKDSDKAGTNININGDNNNVTIIINDDGNVTVMPSEKSGKVDGAGADEKPDEDDDDDSVHGSEDDDGQGSSGGDEDSGVKTTTITGKNGYSAVKDADGNITYYDKDHNKIEEDAFRKACPSITREINEEKLIAKGKNKYYVVEDKDGKFHYFNKDNEEITGEKFQNEGCPKLYERIHLVAKGMNGFYIKRDDEGNFTYYDNYDKQIEEKDFKAACPNIYDNLKKEQAEKEAEKRAKEAEKNSDKESDSDVPVKQKGYIDLMPLRSNHPIKYSERLHDVTLTPEQKAKVDSCSTAEEVVAYLKTQGIEISQVY